MIRKAKVKDVKPIYQLLDYYGKKGDLLSRPLSRIYDHLRDFFVYIDEEKQKITGCCALQICWEDLAEIRSLAVDKEYTKKGMGFQLVAAAISEASELHIKKIFTLTYQPDFFKKLGFSPISRSDLPLKIWSDCIACVKFPHCDENAMLRHI